AFLAFVLLWSPPPTQTSAGFLIPLPSSRECINCQRPDNVFFLEHPSLRGWIFPAATSSTMTSVLDSDASSDINGWQWNLLFSGRGSSTDNMAYVPRFCALQ
ncbi:hypothetical protein HPB47_013969, partial [Ixodes persulcatus]